MTLLEKFEEQQGIGKEIGKEIGKDEVSAMYLWLQDSDRADDMRKAFADKELRNKLLAEFKGTPKTSQ